MKAVAVLGEDFRVCSRFEFQTRPIALTTKVVTRTTVLNDVTAAPFSVVLSQLPAVKKNNENARTLICSNDSNLILPIFFEVFCLEDSSAIHQQK